MRKLIAAMKLSLDGKVEGADGMADWVEAWSEDFGLTPQVDACLLGGGMYPGYERYWSGIQAAPDQPAWITGLPPTEAERAWARFAAGTPHYVLSTTLTEALWPNTCFLQSAEDVADLKRKAGRDIYLVGGGRTTASLIDAGLVDELRLILHPLIAGEGKALFGDLGRHRLELSGVEPLSGGKVGLVYGIG